MISLQSDADLTDIEIGLLLEGIYQYRGYDFREYDPGYLKRMVMKAIADEGLETVSELQARVMHSPEHMERFLQSLSIGTSTFFYEPRFFSTLIAEVIPLLSSIPSLKIWVAGCICGAETYSLAILLEEEGVHDNVKIYSSQMNEKTLANERSGIVPIGAIRGCARNYRMAGGKKRLTHYYSSNGEGFARLTPSLQTNITWAQHNFVTDASFNQFNCILCRNVLGYFSQLLKERMHKLLYESLTIGGLLGLGCKEDMASSPYEEYYELIDDLGQWYIKTG